VGLGGGPDGRLWSLIAVLDTQPASLVQRVSPSSPRRLDFAQSNWLVVYPTLGTTVLIILLGNALRQGGLEDQGGD